MNSALELWSNQSQTLAKILHSKISKYPTSNVFADNLLLGWGGKFNTLYFCFNRTLSEPNTSLIYSQIQDHGRSPSCAPPTPSHFGRRSIINNYALNETQGSRCELKKVKRVRYTPVNVKRDPDVLLQSVLHVRVLTECLDSHRRQKVIILSAKKALQHIQKYMRSNRKRGHGRVGACGCCGSWLQNICSARSHMKVKTERVFVSTQCTSLMSVSEILHFWHNRFPVCSPFEFFY